ncbi:CinA family protein [[Clostridium] aminophilum]|uniref:CinA family protein n=1 Tax=[Clostridium] aminophilum TaxID=1526 RepID=UPI003F970400
MSDYDHIRRKYENLVRYLIKHHISITTMESCTSGQIASLITDTEGASAIMKGAFVTYSNEAKIRQGVSAETIGRFGVYSKETAEEMARSCRKFYDADIGIGVTGSFGNTDPNNEDSVPGEVYFAITAGENTVSFFCSVPEQKSRLDYKFYMADIIADALTDVLIFRRNNFNVEQTETGFI